MNKERPKDLSFFHLPRKTHNYLTVSLRLRRRKKALVERKKQATPAPFTNTTDQKAAP